MGRPRLYPIDPKPCAMCGVTFTIHADERPAAFAKRITCGPVCGKRLAGLTSRAEAPNKVCVVCGGTFSRREGEIVADYRSRVTCGAKECISVHRGNSRRRPTDAKSCTYCGKPLERRKQEGPLDFARRKTCGPLCGSKQTGVSRRLLFPDPPPRYCTSCGVLLERRDGETTYSFVKRQTCDRACGKLRAIATLQGRHARLSPYPPEWQAAIRPRILRRDAHCCRLCNALPGKRNHHVHHIDGVKGNVDDFNLITLCPPCHTRVSKGDADHWRAVLSALVLESA